MKISSVLSFGLCLTFAMGQDVVNEVGKKTIKTNTKAASTYQNCNCQCDSYTWSDGIYIRGNCRRYSRSHLKNTFYIYCILYMLEKSFIRYLILCNFLKHHTTLYV